MILRRISLFTLGMLLIFLQACSLSAPTVVVGTPTPIPSPTTPPEPMPPAVIETVPPRGSQLPVLPTILFYFNQAMNTRSVEAALKNSLKLEGIFSWPDESTMVFTATKPLAAHTRLVFTLAAGVSAANGLKSSEPQGFDYQITDQLLVSQTLPGKNSTDVTPVSQVVATFNQPMVALGAEPGSLPDAFSLNPPVSGKGEWLNTSTYVFRPEPALAGGATYTATINPLLTSQAGIPLEAPYSWSFSTSKPQIVSIDPTSKGLLDLEPVFTITFNQPMDTASVAAATRLEGPGGSVFGTSQWDEKGSRLTFTPEHRLDRNQRYRLVIPADVRSQGGALLETPVSQEYTTHPDFSILSGPSQPKPYYGNFTFILSGPLKEYDPLELADLIEIDPPIGSYYANANVNEQGEYQVSLGGSFDSTPRTITFSGLLTDKWGQRLSQPVSFTVSSLPPDPTVDVPSALRTFFVRPENPILNVQVAGVETIEITRAPLSLSEYFEMHNNYAAMEAYQPINSVTWTASPMTGENMRNYGLNMDYTNNPLPTGLYSVGIGSSSYGPRFMFCSNINVTIKMGAHDALVWAVDLRTQQPVDGAPVSLYDGDGKLLAQGTTNPSGIWQSKDISPVKFTSLPFFAVLGQPGDDLFGVGSTAFNPGIAPWDFGVSYTSEGESPDLYLYTDRPIYRPGQKISYRGILKTAFNGRYTPMDVSQEAWSVNLLDEFGEKAGSNPIVFNEYGSFDGQIQVPFNAQPGMWVLNVSGGLDEYGNPRGYSIYFNVADYRKPEINLQVSFDQKDVVSLGKVAATIRAEYFFGESVSDLPFEWRLYRRNSYFEIPGGYTSGNQVNSWWSPANSPYGGLVREGKGRTGATGDFSLALEGLSATQTSVYTLEVTASESGGYPVSIRSDFVMHPAAQYVGILPNQFIARAGNPNLINLTLVDWQRKPVGNQTILAKLQRVTWKRAKNWYPYSPSYEPVYTPIEEKSVQLDAQASGDVSFVAPTAGTYAVVASYQNAESATLIWVGGPGDAVWPDLPFDQLKLTSGQTHYKPGDTATVFIPNPYNENVAALVTTERGAILSSQQITVPQGGYSLSIPLTDDNAPNTYVSATLLGLDGTFKQGYTEFEVEPTNFILNVDLSASTEKAKPGEQITLNLVVTDSKKQPVQGDFSLAVVDLAALALADPIAQDIVPAYYSPRPLGIMTGLSLAVSGLRFFQEPGGRGGGGGGGMVSLRENFPDTALWSHFVTDAQGRAQVSLTLPDNLTTWQVDTRGLDKSARVGQTRMNLVVSKELLLRPLTPRYFVAGDHTLLGTQVNNTTDQDMQATVSISVRGVTLDDSSKVSQQVTVPAHGRATVQWWAKVENEASAELIFEAKSGAFQDATRPTDGLIPILRYLAPQTYSTAGVLAGAGARKEVVSLPRSFEPKAGGLTVSLTPSLGNYLLNTAKKLPVPDTDISNADLAARIMAEIALQPVYDKLGLTEAEKQSRQEELKGWLRRLRTAQNADAGWDWSRREIFSELPSDPIVTAQVLMALGQAQRAGLLGEGDLSWLQNAQNYLAGFLVADSNTTGDKMDEIAFLAYGYYSVQGPYNLAPGPEGMALDVLYQWRDRLNPASRALLYTTLVSTGFTNPDLLDNLEATAVRSSTGAFWENLNSGMQVPSAPVYTTAVVLSVLSERGATPLNDDALRYLISSQSNSRGTSALETAWVVRALVSILIQTNETDSNYGYRVGLNRQTILTASPQDKNSQQAGVVLGRLYPDAPNELVIDRQAGAGRLYYRADLEIYRPAQDAPALSQGITVMREYLNCAAKPCYPTQSLRMGGAAGVVTVRLTVVLPHAMYYLNVEDFAPAGAEIINPMLKTSQLGQQTENVQVFDEANPFDNGWGWWIFQNPRIYRDHIRWSAARVEAGTYILTYSLSPSIPGRYQVIPAHAWMQYFPEVQGTSSGGVFEIQP